MEFHKKGLGGFVVHHSAACPGTRFIGSVLDVMGGLTIGHCTAVPQLYTELFRYICQTVPYRLFHIKHHSPLSPW